MSEERVEIELDLKMGKTASAGLDDLAKKAKDATQETARLQAKYEEVMSAAGRSTAQTSAAWEKLKDAEQKATAAARQYADAVQGTPFTATITPRATGNAASLQQTLTSQVSQAAAGAGTGLEAVVNKMKGVGSASTQLASTYQLLEEKQSALAKTAQRGYRTDQPISFLEPQPRRPSIYGLAEDRLPKPKWSTERETIPVAGTPPPLPSPVPPRTPRVRPSTEPKPVEENVEVAGKRLGRGLRGILGQLSASSANMISGTMLAGFTAQMAGSAMSGIAKMHDTLSNTSLSQGERVQRVVEEIPIIGSLAKGSRDLLESFSGLNEMVRKSSLAHETFMSNLSIMSSTRQQREPLESRLVEIQAKANSAVMYKPDYGPAPAAGNPYQLKRYQQTTPIIRQVAAAQDERRVTEQLLMQADTHAASGRGLAATGKAGAEHWQNFLDTHKLAPGMTEKMLLPAREQLRGALALQLEGAEMERRALEDKVKLSERFANAGSTERLAGIQAKKYELEDVNEKEAKLRGRYQTFGGMMPGTRSMALQAARQAKQLGYESLGEYQRGLIKSVAPEYAQERELELGKKYGADEFAKLIPSKNEDKRTLGELQQKQVELTQDIDIKIDLNPELLRRDIAERVDDAIEKLQLKLGEIERIRKDSAAAEQARRAAANT